MIGKQKGEVLEEIETYDGTLYFTENTQIR